MADGRDFERLAAAPPFPDGAASESLPFPLSEAQRRELIRRIADDDANPDDVIPWEEVKAKARARRAKPKAD